MFEHIDLVEDHCAFLRSIEAMSAMFAIKMDLDKLKHTPILENKYAQDWDTTEFENNPLFSACFVSQAELAYELAKHRFELWRPAHNDHLKLWLCTCHIRTDTPETQNRFIDCDGHATLSPN